MTRRANLLETSRRLGHGDSGRTMEQGMDKVGAAKAIERAFVTGRRSQRGWLAVCQRQPPHEPEHEQGC